MAFEESLDISRKILARVGETPEALRDLSVSLDNAGQIAQALGELERARVAFEGAAEIRKLLERPAG